MPDWRNLSVTVFILSLSSVWSQSNTTRKAVGTEPFVDKASGAWKYPSFARDESVSETYFGVEVKDPYRKLENHLDAKTIEFERAQSDFATRYVGQEPTLANIEARMREMESQERYSHWEMVNGTMYIIIDPGNFEQKNLMRRLPDGDQMVFNVEMEYERPYSSIYHFYPSPNGRYIAIPMTRKGSDWTEIRVVTNDAKNTLLPDKVLWSSGNSAITWSADSLGFYYNAYQPPKDITPEQAGLETDLNVYLGNFYHKLFTRSSDLQIIDPKVNLRTVGVMQNLDGDSEYREIDQDKGLFIIQESEANNRTAKIFVHNRNNRAGVLEEVLPQYPSNTKRHIGTVGNRMYILTDINAPNNRLIAVDLNDLKTIIPLIGEYLDKILNDAYFGKPDKLALHYKRGGLSKVELYDAKTLQFIDIINIEYGGIYGVSFNSDNTEFAYSVLNFISKNSQYIYNFATKTNKLIRENVFPNFNSKNYVQKSNHYLSKDGQEIPVIYVHHKDLKPDGTNMVYLLAYGGFDGRTNPSYDKMTAYLIENERAVVAFPIIRGNSDLGKGWWHAGRYLDKQKSYDDMAAAVKFFQSNPETKFGSPGTTFIHGASNGGLMAAAVCNQIPEKLAGCFAEVGVHDLVRFPKFTSGKHWIYEYGDVSRDKLDLDNILKLSPLHNVLPTKSKGLKTYPHLWISTGEYDNRVSKLHSFKFAATIQNFHKFAQNPALLYVNFKSGHGNGRAKSQDIKDKANKVAFMKLAMKEFQGKSS